MHGIPIGTAEVIISDGGMVYVGNFESANNQNNLGLVTDQMSFDGKDPVNSGCADDRQT